MNCTIAQYDYNYCFHRLPCGYCSYMSRPCPYPSNTINPGPHITWTTGTGTTIGSDSCTTGTTEMNDLFRKEMEKKLNVTESNMPLVTNPCVEKEN